MSFDYYSQRAAFTTAMTFLATLSGTTIAAYELRRQPDLIIDVIKIGGILALGTACVSYVVWSIIHLKKSDQVRGGLAGLITSFAIIPLPNFASAFKTRFLANISEGEAGYLMPAIDALVPAVKIGLETFQVITKVSLVVLIASFCLGVIIVWLIPSTHDET